MFNIDTVLDNITARLEPASTTIREVAQTYADRILSRLDDIADGVQDEDWTEVRRPISLALGAGAPVEVATVPVGDSWEVEYIAVSGATDLTITTEGGLRFAKVFAGMDTLTPGTMLRSGEVVSLTSTNAVQVFVQFRLRTRKPGRPAPGAGQPEQSPDAPSEDRTGRHVQVGTFDQGAR